MFLHRERAILLLMIELACQKTYAITSERGGTPLLNCMFHSLNKMKLAFFSSNLPSKLVSFNSLPSLGGSFPFFPLLNSSFKGWLLWKEPSAVDVVNLSAVLSSKCFGIPIKIPEQVGLPSTKLQWQIWHPKGMRGEERKILWPPAKRMKTARNLRQNFSISVVI